METFAYLESAVAYEDPNPQPQLKTLKELGLTVPSSAWLGLAAILLSASMFVAQVPQVHAFPATVTASSGVNIRSGPGTNYAIIGGLGNGARVNVVSTSSGWYQISGGGWIAGNYTSGNATPPAGGGPGTGTPVSGTVTVTSASGVNIRSGPSTAYSIIGGLGNGARANVVSLSNGFYRLSSGGWIAANLTSGIGSGGGPGTGTPVNRTVTVTSASGVNIRSGPGTNYAIIGGLGNGARANVVALSNGFYRLSSGGWIAASLTSGGSTTPPMGGPGTGFVTIRAASGVNVRSGPGTSYAIIGGLGNGARVRVVSSSNGFYQLSSGGWVSSAYASP
jgi:uncharacterized protein YraI